MHVVPTELGHLALRGEPTGGRGWLCRGCRKPEFRDTPVCGEEEGTHVSRLASRALGRLLEAQAVGSSVGMKVTSDHKDWVLLGARRGAARFLWERMTLPGLGAGSTGCLPPECLSRLSDALHSVFGSAAPPPISKVTLPSGLPPAKGHLAIIPRPYNNFNLKPAALFGQTFHSPRMPWQGQTR